MIQLQPFPDANFNCPYDNQKLQVLGWYIPGMRNLAVLQCPDCKKEYYGDLLSGQALYTPLLLEKKNGRVYDSFNVKWFAEWLEQSYNKRSDEPLRFTEEINQQIKQPVLLNCLDTLYGHSLLKLLNAQYYLDKHPNLDLIVLIPRIFRWMVPDGVAAIWTVDLPLKCGNEWNDWLGSEIHKRLKNYNECFLSVAYSHPHPKSFSIERFTGITPFPIDEWYERIKKPTVTFIWREDRHWVGEGFSTPINHLIRRFLFNNLIQRRKIVSLATHLRKELPNLDFSVVGLGESGSFPTWISDLRTANVDDEVEKAWCEQYASSHVVIGVHGSNMLLPSAHAGATIELLPQDRLGNILQDLLMKDVDCREAIYRYRIFPDSISVVTLSDIIYSLLKNYKSIMLDMNWNNLSHDQEINNTLYKKRTLLMDLFNNGWGKR